MFLCRAEEKPWRRNEINKLQELIELAAKVRFSIEVAPYEYFRKLNRLKDR